MNTHLHSTMAKFQTENEYLKEDAILNLHSTMAKFQTLRSLRNVTALSQFTFHYG